MVLFVIHYLIKTFGSDLEARLSFLEPKFFFLAIIFSLVAQIGDLIISFLKRLEHIKDTGIILPGHGGIFDRIDGLIFVVILAFVLDIFDVFP